MIGMSTTDSSADRVPQWDANLYEAHYSFVWERGRGVLQLLAPQAGERILDLGCGTGHLSAQIAETGARVVGIDSSEEMISEARRKYPQVEFGVADARSFRFEQPFDAVFSNAVLHWVREADLVIESAWKALRPGGRYVIEMGGKGNVRKIEVALTAAYQRFSSPSPPGLGDPNPWYYPSIGEYSGLLERQGFEVSFAALFDRPTPLENGEEGLRNWIRMFGGTFLKDVPEREHQEFLRYVESETRPSLFRDGGWVADYRRLRLVAVKK
jgi:trans-aconitate methyltransferase